MSPLACPAADSISGTATMAAGWPFTSELTASRSAGADSSMKPPATRVPSAAASWPTRLASAAKASTPAWSLVPCAASRSAG